MIGGIPENDKKNLFIYFYFIFTLFSVELKLLIYTNK